MHGIAYYDKYDGILPETYMQKSDDESVRACLQMAEKRLMHKVSQSNVIAVKLEFDSAGTESLRERFEGSDPDPVSKIAQMMD